jgi:lysozyme
VLGAPSPDWPKGIDVASWQHPGGAAINWTSVRNSGVTFAFVKATEGGTYTNPYFVADRRDAAAAGLVVGAYHYARPALPVSTAAEQARRFLGAVGNVALSGHFAPVLDLEATGGLNASQLAAWTKTFLEEIEIRTGRAPILYTYRSFWTDLVGNSTAFSRYPLWFAIYNDGTTPGKLPGGWTSWAIWQHSPAGRVPGISGNVDLNAVCCSPAALAALGDGRLTELAKRYASDPAVRWVLGPPTRAEGPAGGGGRWQPHQNGLLFWSVDTGALEVHGSIAAKYLALGGSNGFLRRPVTDETDASATGSRQSVFQGGRIYWSQATGAFEVHGSILAHYLKLGGSGSHLGLPVSDEYSVPGGRQSSFQRGVLRWDAATGQVTAIGV